jgi:hypothetical protein
MEAKEEEPPDLGFAIDDFIEIEGGRLGTVLVRAK